MKLKVFAVKDAGADAFIPPFCLPTESMALREFANLAGNPEHNFGKYKNDYSLYLLGSFDDGSGLFELLPEPRFLMSADGRVAEQGLLFDRGLN